MRGRGEIPVPPPVNGDPQDPEVMRGRDYGLDETYITAADSYVRPDIGKERLKTIWRNVLGGVATKNGITDEPEQTQSKSD